ncbi:Exodeoxyribonuclease 7 small subunit [Labeo rohita]|uniref:Exodeoxyribonuclease 7 small subunit n=1 Tax=Labeo rohita TaxID=84645 RepID=A0ABQ8LZB1_LABRO|nr:Exodeoxyribonuclease 7 small subunit [Labeo rohita]
MSGRVWRTPSTQWDLKFALWKLSGKLLRTDKVSLRDISHSLKELVKK